MPSFPDDRPVIVFDGKCVLCLAVELSHPLTGLIVRYRGWLVPDLDAPLDAADKSRL